MSEFTIQMIVFVFFGLICVGCYRAGLMDGKEYMLDILNEAPEDEKDECCDR